MATCKSCGAAIVWAKTKAGKHMPMDPEPEQLLVEIGTGTDGERIWPVVEVRKAWRSHWATCPQAAEHRRRS